MKKFLIIAMFGLIKFGHGQALLTNLQGCYPLDCDSALNGAPTGSSLNGTIHNVTCTTGHAGGTNTAYQFGGGPGSYISLPGTSALKPSNAITVSGWYNVTSTTSSQYLVFTKNTCFSNFEAYYLVVANTGSSAKFKAGLSGSGCSPVSVTSPANITAGTWYHVVFYIDNSTVSLYVNNVLVGSTTHTTPFNYASGKNVVLGGSNESAFNLPFSGKMDNIRFWDRQLTTTEITDLYTFDPGCSNPGINLLSGLEACYPLDCDSAKNEAFTTMFTPPSLNGTLFNVYCTNGHTNLPNTAYQFKGLTSSYISLPNDNRLKPNAISFTGWFYIDSLPNIQYLVYTKNNCSTNFEAYYLATYNSGSGQRFSVGKSNSSCNYAQLSSNTTLSTGNWYHVAFFINNSVIKLYINGVLDNSLTHTNIFSYNTSKNVILGGTNESSYNLPFKGRMDNLRFYSRELIANEVLDIYVNDPICRAQIRPVGLVQNSLNEKEMRVFPNPNTGKMYINNTKGHTLMICDINGKNIGFTQTQIDEKTTEIKLNTQSEGFYFVKMINTEGKIVQVLKIVVTP